MIEISKNAIKRGNIQNFTEIKGFIFKVHKENGLIYDRYYNINLNCGHRILSTISESGLNGLLHILSDNPYCIQCHSRIRLITIKQERKVIEKYKEID